jgi:hypothetical protein
MLAKNSELKDTELNEETKGIIDMLHNDGSRFVVGDMPGVDSQFIEYLDEIGATYTIYHAGNEPRITGKSSNSTLPLKGSERFFNKNRELSKYYADSLDSIENTLKAISENSKSKAYSAIAKALMQVPFIKRTKIKRIKASELYERANRGRKEEDRVTGAGLYSPSENTIYISDEVTEDRYFEWAFLHEAIHAITRNALRYSDEFKGRVTNILNKVRQAVRESGMSEDDLEMNRIGYAIKNEDEFLSESLTNDDFNSLLSSIPSDNKEGSEKGNMFTEFMKAIWDYIKKFLGKGQRSLLEDITDLIYEAAAIENEEIKKEQYYADNAGNIDEDYFSDYEAWLNDQHGDNQTLPMAVGLSPVYSIQELHGIYAHYKLFNKKGTLRALPHDRALAWAETLNKHGKMGYRFTVRNDLDGKHFNIRILKPSNSMYSLSSQQNSLDSAQDIETVSRRFNEELQQQIDGTLPKNHVYRLGMPSEALLSNIDNLPIEMAASILRLKSSKEYKSNHPFNLKDIANLPKAISEPIAVFESETDPNRTVVLTELKNKSGDNFIAILGISRMEGRNTNVVNEVISIYPKESSAHIAKWFLGSMDKGTGRDILK